jgi:cytochrome c
MRCIYRYAALAIGLLSASAAFAAGDAIKGQAVFARCSACHALSQDKIGPHLAGVAARKAGSVAGFNYSPAMKAYGKPWTAERLDTFLAGPAKAVPGTFMISGVASPTDRADVIAYLMAAR